MAARPVDPVASFYDRYPYPPQPQNLSGYAESWRDPARRRAEHHLLWPHLPYREDQSVLVAGCGTSQAAKYALRYPAARVVGADVSAASIDQTRALAERHGIQNLELHVLPLEDVANLDRSFDQIVCTGVIHHLTDPDRGLRALSDALTPDGALHLMVYAPYGRAGVYMLQEYARRLGLGAGSAEIADLAASLRELPLDHPMSRLLRESPEFHHDGSIADALLNPRDRAYSVPEVLELVRSAGLEFGRWVRQAPYLPYCGGISTVPHGARIAALPRDEQYAALELFRGTMTRHSLIAHRANGSRPYAALDRADSGWERFVPHRVPTVAVVEQGLPEGAAAALLNSAHEHTDLVLLVDEEQRTAFAEIDGRRAIREIAHGDVAFFERLWHHDLVVLDASSAFARRAPHR